MYQNLGEIYEGLQKTRENLIQTLENLPAEKHEWRENGAGWSIKEIVEHLALVEAGIIKIVQRLIGKAAESENAAALVFPPLPSDFGDKLESIRERKIQAPERFHPQGNQNLADSLATLKNERGILHDLQAKLEKIDASAPAFPHPAIGDLNAYQWIIMIGLHEKRHLMQIQRILQNN